VTTESTTRPAGGHRATQHRDALVDEYGRATTDPLGDLNAFRQKLADTVDEAVSARDEQFIAWLLKKARDSRNSRESTEDYLIRLADKVERGAIR